MKRTKSNLFPKNKCFDVEYIITRRTEGKKNYYLIKWEGYPIKDCSWEPISHLTNVMDMVNEFDDNFPNSIEQKSLKEFYAELRKYKHQKFLQKKRMMKNGKEKKLESNKIVINIDKLNSDYSIKKKEEKNKNELKSISLFEIDENDDNEKNKENENIIIENISNFEIKKDEENEKNYGKLKLIKPIIIW